MTVIKDQITPAKAEEVASEKYPKIADKLYTALENFEVLSFSLVTELNFFKNGARDGIKEAKNDCERFHMVVGDGLTEARQQCALGLDFGALYVPFLERVINAAENALNDAHNHLGEMDELSEEVEDWLKQIEYDASCDEYEQLEDEIARLEKQIAKLRAQQSGAVINTCSGVRNVP